MKRLTEVEFLEAIEGLQVGPRTLEIARACLVTGEKQALLVRRFGISKGAVSQAVARVWAAHRERVPPGYERVSAVLPAHRAFQVRKWAAAARQRLRVKAQ
jgi:DNA-binding transcriptional regulator YdaS (Cro superfamily)